MVGRHPRTQQVTIAPHADICRGPFRGALSVLTLGVRVENLGKHAKEVQELQIHRIFGEVIIAHFGGGWWLPRI